MDSSPSTPERVPSEAPRDSESPESPRATGGARVRTLLELSPEETVEAFARLGAPAFQARTARRDVFERGLLTWDAMTHLSKALRERLRTELPILAGTELARSTARDGTTKLLLGFGDPEGQGQRSESVEVVVIPSLRSGRGATICVSTQIGCPVACPFCASGKAGLLRNLTRHEILEQYVRGRAVAPLARSVVMGIGEPLLNFEALESALVTVRDEVGIGARKITVSTVGFPDRLARALERTGARPGFQLAISLHSPDDEQRAELVPAMAETTVEEVLAAGDQWFEQTGREVTYEYVLLGGANDSPGHAERLAQRLAGRRATVNLIPYNPLEGERWRRPRAEDVEGFRATLEEAGIVATVRWSRGLEADAACGQLRRRTSPGSQSPPANA